MKHELMQYLAAHIPKFMCSGTSIKYEGKVPDILTSNTNPDG